MGNTTGSEPEMKGANVGVVFFCEQPENIKIPTKKNVIFFINVRPRKNISGIKKDYSDRSASTGCRFAARNEG